MCKTLFVRVFFYFIACLTAQTVALLPAFGQSAQTFTLSSGWNLIGSYLTPTDPLLEAVWTGVSPVLVKDGSGRIFSPGYRINEIGSWDATKAYKVYMQSSGTLNIDGSTFDRTEIPLNQGWNYVPFTRSESLPITEYFQSISTSLVIVKNINGDIYAPSYGITTLNTLQPGQGYYVNVSQGVTLVYDPNSTTPSATGKEYYVSTTGSAQGNGTLSNPWDLNTAINYSGLAAGDIIWLSGGIYKGPHSFSRSISGTQPVTVRSRKGERAVLDGKFSRSGGGIRWQDIEFGADGWTTRQSSQTGSHPTDMPDYRWDMYAKDQVINCIVRDHNGNGFWTSAENALIYGSIFFNQGWQASDRGHGHAMYTQNASGTKRFKHNVFVKGFSGQTIQGYTQSSSIQGFNFEENVAIDGRWLVGGGTPVARLYMTRNHIWGVTLLGYSDSVVNEDATLVDNVLKEPLATRGTWKNLQQTGTKDGDILNSVHVYKNEYDAERGLVVIYNASKASSVSVDLSKLSLVSGRAYRLVNSLNLREGVDFTYNGSPVSVSMNGWTVQRPVAWSTPLVSSTFPAFGVFIVQPK